MNGEMDRWKDRCVDVYWMDGKMDFFSSQN